MDKKKTGNLIKEARIKKNYTQNELGKKLLMKSVDVINGQNVEAPRPGPTLTGFSFDAG